MRVLGIDPGVYGWAAVVNTVAHRRVLLVDAFPLPIVGEENGRRLAVKKFSELLGGYKLDRIVVERAQLMKGQDVGAGGMYMRLTGHLEACSLLAGVPTYTVDPNTWKPKLGLGGKKRERDDGAPSEQRLAVELAASIFKSDADHFALVKDHNKAEAALIAAFGGDPILSSYLKLIPG